MAAEEATAKDLPRKLRRSSEWDIGVKVKLLIGGRFVDQQLR
jgi:hypothetical protein